MLEVAPFPPRYWWLKRISLGALIVLVSLTTFRIAIGVYAQRRFDAHVAELCARGEPTRPEDLAAGEINDEENAAFHLQQAATVVVAKEVSSPRSGGLVYPSYPPYPPEWWTAAEASYAAKQAALVSARTARACTQSAFPRHTSPGIIYAFTGWYNAQRELANSLADAAEYQHLRGNDREALELMRDLFRQAEAITAEPLLISALVGMGIRELAQSTLMLIAPGLSNFETDSDNFATREQTRELIDRLLDEGADKRAWRSTLLTERVALFDTFNTTFAGSVILRPAYQLEYQREIQRFDASFAANEADTWPAARDAFRARNPPHRRQNARTIGINSALSTLRSPTDGVIRINYRFRLGSRVAAVSLAAQLFRHDHGRWPATLEELVPVYLPDVPRDPFATDGGPLRYVMVGDRPIVYSAGEDGVTQPDPASRVPATPSYGWINYRRASTKKDDQYFDLSRFIPSAAATQASEE